MEGEAGGGIISRLGGAFGGAGWSRAARPAYPSVAQLPTIHLPAPQLRGGPGINERPQRGAIKRGIDTIAAHSLALPQPAGHQGISRGPIRVVGYGS